MGKSSEKTARRIQEAEHVNIGVSEVICSECEDACYSVAVIAAGTVGSESYRTYLFVREHQELGQALRLLGGWLMGHGSIITGWDEQRWIMEHQLTLL